MATSPIILEPEDTEDATDVEDASLTPRPVDAPNVTPTLTPVDPTVSVVATRGQASQQTDDIDAEFVRRKQDEVILLWQDGREARRRAAAGETQATRTQRGRPFDLLEENLQGAKRQRKTTEDLEALIKQARTPDEEAESEEEEQSILERIGLDLLQPLGAAEDLFIDVMQAINTLGNLERRYIGLVPPGQIMFGSTIPKAETPEGDATRSLLKFSAWFFPLLRAAKIGLGLKAGIMGEAVGGILAGAMTDLVQIDPESPRMTELLTNLIPELKNPLFDFLETDPGDPVALAKFKGAIDGVLTGVGVDMLVQVGRILKGSKAVGSVLRRFKSATRRAASSASVQSQAPAGILGQIDELSDETIDAAVAREVSASDARQVAALDKLQAQLSRVLEGEEETIDAVLKARRAVIGKDGAVAVPKGGRGRGTQGARLDRYPTKQDAAEDMLNRARVNAQERDFFTPERALKDAFGFDPDKPWPRAQQAVTGEEATLALEAREAARRPLVEITEEAEQRSARFIIAQPGLLTIEGKTPHVNFNMITSSADVREAIAQTSALVREAAEKQRRGTQTIDEIITASKGSRFQDVEEILGIQPGSALNASDAFAVRQVWIDSANQLMEVATAVKNGNFSRTNEFLNQFVIHSNIHIAFTGVRAEAGRATRAFGIDLTPGVRGQIQNLTKIIEAQNGIDPVRLAEMIASIPSPEKLARFSVDAQRATTSDVVLETWINALLSNPTTHVVNLLSNALTTAWAIPERFLAAGMGGIQAREGVYLMRGMIAGVGDGFTLAWQAFKTGEPQRGVSKVETMRRAAVTGKTFNTTGSIGKGIDFLGQMIRLPGRFLIAGDEFFKAINYRGELEAQALRQATGEGLTGNAHAARVAAIIQDPSPGIKDASENFAFYQTFTNMLDQEGAAFEQLGRFTQKLSEGLDEAPILRVTLPFIRTPFNIARFTAERTPLGLLSRNVFNALRSGGPAGALARSKMALGTMTMAMLASYAAEGRITGKGPGNKALQDTKRRLGWQPYSLRIGETYVSYSRLDPLGNLIGIVADYVEARGEMDDDSAMAIAGAAMMAFYQNISSKTYLKGVSTLVKTLSPPGYNSEAAVAFKPGQRFLSQLAGSVVPSGVANLTRSTGIPGVVPADPILRDARSALDRVRSRLPGLSTTVKPRRNLWGEPILLEAGIPWGMVNPLYIRTRKPDVVDNKIWELRVPLNHAPRTWLSSTGAPVELSSNQYERFQLLSAGEGLEGFDTTLKASLGALIQNREFATTDLEFQRDDIRAEVADYRRAAKEQLLDEDEDLRIKVRGGVLERQQGPSISTRPPLSLDVR